MGTRISVKCSGPVQNTTSSYANRTDVEGLDNSVEIAAGRATNGADASFATDRNV